MKTCASCGGVVGEDGMSVDGYDDGGMVDVDATTEEEKREPSPQMMSRRFMMDAAFNDAVAAEPITAERMESAIQDEEAEEELSEIQRLKREKYGWGKR